MKKISLLILMLSAFTCFSQEICDNAIDDDGDGLIDLNDNECLCNGELVPSIIPNASFESFDVCPSDISQLDFCTDWMQATQPTTDYMHTCNYVAESVITAGLDNFPDGGGIAGAIFQIGWCEYLGSCLNTPMQAGETYQMTVNIASLPVDGGIFTCNGGEIYYEPIDITLYGSESCSILPLLEAVDAPSLTNPGWFVLGSINYTPVKEWGQITISFTPSVDIDAIMIGAPEVLPFSYTQPGACLPYFLFDNLLLNESALFGVNISQAGIYCNDDLVLTANPAVPVSASAAYQWYNNGIAIIGANESTYAVPQAPGNLGSYNVKILDGTNCFISPSLTPSAMLPPPAANVIHPTCFENGTITITTEADQYSFDNGTTWSTNPVAEDIPPGTHYIKIKNDSGCVSSSAAVLLDYPEYTQQPYVTTTNATCGPTGTITVVTEAAEYSFDNGETWVTNPVLNNVYGGEYLVLTKDEDGCMSQPAYVYVWQDYLDYPEYTTVQPGCSNDDGSITITTPAAQYSFDGGVTWVANPTLTGLAAGEYYIAIKDSEGCISNTNYAYLYQVYLDYPQYEAVPGCNNQGSITITTPAYEYSINGGNTWVTTPEFNNLSPGYYNIIIKDADGCVSYPNTIWLEPLTIASPKYDYVAPGCNQSGSITIETEAAEYSFDGGNTWTTDNVLNDLVPYQYYSIIIRNDEGCESWPTDIYVYPDEDIPSAPVVNPTQPSCTNPEGSISITSTASQYSFDNGVTWSTSNNSGPLPGGTYFVKVKNSQGCESSATQVVINDPVNVPDAPQVTVTDPTCTLATGSITVTTGAAQYSFDNGNTWVNTNIQNNLVPGTYQIKIKNAAGCISSATTAEISSETGPAPLPTVNIIQPNCIIATGTITITNSVAEYSFDDGATWSTENSMSGLAEGTYLVRIKNASGCISQPLEVVITVEIIPVPETENIDYCQDAAATALTASGTNLLWYENQAGGAASAAAPIPSTENTGATTYYVSQTINGCESERSSITVMVWPTPETPVATTDIEYCQGESTVALTATGTNLLWYTVPTGGTGSATAPTPSSQTPGTYTFYVSQSLNDCESDRAPITVIVNPTPDAPQTEAVITYEHLDATLPLTAEGTNLTWYDDDMDILNAAPVPSSAHIGSTTYYVNQTIDNCEGPMVEITVNITPNFIDIEYPKFFSPNGDGMRDTWNIFPPEQGVRATVEIYDRYGKIITVLKAPGTGWDGNYNGRPLPATDYWFKVVYKEYGVEKEFTAHFSLLR